MQCSNFFITEFGKKLVKGLGASIEVNWKNRIEIAWNFALVWKLKVLNQE